MMHVLMVTSPALGVGVIGLLFLWLYGRWEKRRRT